MLNGIYIGLFSLLSLEGFGQSEKVNAVPTEQTEKDFDNNTKQKIDKNNNTKKRVQKDSIYIKGTLTDQDGLPQVGANVIIKGTQIGTSTDFDGNYRLNVTKPLDSLGKITLSYFHIGFETKEITIDSDLIKHKENREINVSLFQGEVTEFIVIEKTPLHKRIWNGIKNIFKE
ncbi:carboxypeptidase-like regulatory domain-containing protein [Psychroflexus aestuariivivens]|uniref:carboxypeptidase-like regulatory domain-containing protein n=1 Tax=Psychroflexus aestuariivivens TaxID=1795040 RepID=UPI001960A17E|nr:carboxypeptidase-like regulatory domain-containing protein [Psychroflexus aestuariivivens]